MLKLALSGATALAIVIALSGCATAPDGNPTIGGVEINFGNATLNADLANIAAKLDAGAAIVVSDIPALCQLAASSGQIAAAAATVASSADAANINKAANVAITAAGSALCTQGLTGTLADASTLASTVASVKTALGTTATAIASGTAASGVIAVSKPKAAK